MIFATRAQSPLLLCALVAWLCALVGQASAQSPSLDLMAEGLTAPLDLEDPDDGSGRKLIGQQNGVIKVLGADGRLMQEPFLDITPRLVALEKNFEERGLLGFALHPRFAENGRVFVSYSAPLRGSAPEAWNYTRRVSEFSAKPGDLSKIDARSERILLELDWPSRKHNGGGLTFGPDGYLYIGFGDGGVSHGVGEQVVWEAFNVPREALTWDAVAQDLDSWFGKILRIDVDHGFPGYAIPKDNPFASGGGRPEIWAWGFRNPYRIAFDRNGDGDLFVTAVGETLWESVYRVRGPGNFGWPLMEASHCVDRLHPRNPPASCPHRDAAGRPLEMPIVEYANMQASNPETKLGIAGVGTAVTGARMYRGQALAGLEGRLLVSDWSAAFKRPSGQIFVADPSDQANALWSYSRIMKLDTRIIGLAEDRAGEIYVLTNETLGPYGETGKVFRLVPGAQ